MPRTDLATQEFHADYDTETPEFDWTETSPAEGIEPVVPHSDGTVELAPDLTFEELGPPGP